MNTYVCYMFSFSEKLEELNRDYVSISRLCTESKQINFLEIEMHAVLSILMQKFAAKCERYAD